MSFIELFLIAVGLSMDAFAVAVCAGLTMPKTNVRKALIIGAYFGIFQAAMPLIGYMATTLFADKIINYDHWIAFALLCFLGWKMIAGSLKKEERGGREQAANDMDGRVDAGRKRYDREDAAGAGSGRLSPGVEMPDRKNAAGPEAPETSVKAAQMLPMALATSIDALAVGVSFAFLRVDIVPAVLFIGSTTFSISVLGVKIGSVFGAKFKSKAEIAGGVILILMGFKILLEHLGFISF